MHCEQWGMERSEHLLCVRIYCVHLFIHLLCLFTVLFQLFFLFLLFPFAFLLTKQEISYEVNSGPDGQKRIYTKLVNVSFALTPTRAGEGGFVIIPGSHKSAFPLPSSLATMDSPYASSIVQNPELEPGDAIIFTEAVTHGALSWKGAKERRTVFYRFAPANVGYGRGYFSMFTEDFLSQLTEPQRVILQPPFHLRLDRKALDVETREDGKQEVVVTLPKPRAVEKRNFDEQVFGFPFF
jgi:hypothetical protein